MPSRPPPPPTSAGVPYPFLPWDGALPVHEVHCTVGVFCWDSHKTLRTTTHKHIRATAAHRAVHRDTQVPPPPTAQQPNLNRPHHRDGVARGPLLCRTQKESFPYKWVVFSPSFPLLGESAESDPRHIQSPAKDGRAAISRKPRLLRPFPRSPASEQTCSPESGKRRPSSGPETTLSKSLDGRQTPTGDPSLLPSAGHQGRDRGLKRPLPSPGALHPSVSISEVQRQSPGPGSQACTRTLCTPSRHLAPVPTLVTCSSSRLE